jgi:hypothetical protein
VIAYWCQPCAMFYREVELPAGKRCPECKGPCRPRLVLGGQVIGAAEEVPT